jgi:hypothetical protein
MMTSGALTAVALSIRLTSTVPVSVSTLTVRVLVAVRLLMAIAPVTTAVSLKMALFVQTPSQGSEHLTTQQEKLTMTVNSEKRYRCNDKTFATYKSEALRSSIGEGKDRFVIFAYPCPGYLFEMNCFDVDTAEYYHQHGYDVHVIVRIDKFAHVIEDHVFSDHDNIVRNENAALISHNQFDELAALTDCTQYWHKQLN